jgi:hypothetical protein
MYINIPIRATSSSLDESAHRGSKYYTACSTASESPPRNLFNPCAVLGSVLAVFSLPRFLCNSVLTRLLPLRLSVNRQDEVDEIAFCRQFSCSPHNTTYWVLPLYKIISQPLLAFLPLVIIHLLALRLCKQLSPNTSNSEDPWSDTDCSNCKLLNKFVCALALRCNIIIGNMRFTDVCGRQEI